MEYYYEKRIGDKKKIMLISDSEIYLSNLRERDADAVELSKNLNENYEKLIDAVKKMNAEELSEIESLLLDYVKDPSFTKIELNMIRNNGQSLYYFTISPKDQLYKSIRINSTKKNKSKPKIKEFKNINEFFGYINNEGINRQLINDPILYLLFLYSKEKPFQTIKKEKKKILMKV